MASRNTIQRSLVYEAVNRLKSHATADEIFAELRRRHPALSRATVYRNLKSLADEARIRRLPVPNGADRFDHIPKRHCHMLCENCGRLVDMDMEPPPDLEKAIGRRDGFNITGYDLVFHGICPDCGMRGGE